MKFELLASNIVHKGRAIILRVDSLRTPDGREVNYDIVEHHGSVIIVPIDENGNIYFVRQYRHAAGQDMLELPAGTLEPGEAPDFCAAREIREETGMQADNIKEIGSFYLAPGYSTELMHVFLATGLSHNPLEADDDEFLSVETIPLNEALKQAANGQIADAKSLAALLLAQANLQ